MKISNFTLLQILYLIGIISLFFYSFTQIDLGLTLSQISIWQVAQKNFQYVGYFNRPLSTALFISILVLLYSCYGVLLAKAKENSGKNLWKLIVFCAILLGISYNALSYDLFNYIFDAKIVTYYHQNPYLHKALDFPNDPMLSFMHWIERVYPYGPVWLALTIPLSFLGMQYFLLTFFLFKFLFIGFYLGTTYFIYKILEKIDASGKIYGTIFFALNPLVLIESLVSGHNDIAMMFLALSGSYFLIKKNYLWAVLLFMLSYGVKFASFSYPLPIHVTVLVAICIIVVLVKQFQNRLQTHWKTIFLFLSIFMIIPVVLASFRTNFQPWYLLDIVPFAALTSKKYFVTAPIFIVTLFAQLQYVPFLFRGDWNKPVPTILFWIMVCSIILLVIFVAIFWLKQLKNGTIKTL